MCFFPCCCCIVFVVYFLSDCWSWVLWIHGAVGSPLVLWKDSVCLCWPLYNCPALTKHVTCTRKFTQTHKPIEMHIYSAPYSKLHLLFLIQDKTKIYHAFFSVFRYVFTHLSVVALMCPVHWVVWWDIIQFSSSILLHFIYCLAHIHNEESSLAQYSNSLLLFGIRFFDEGHLCSLWLRIVFFRLLPHTHLKIYSRQSHQLNLSHVSLCVFACVCLDGWIEHYTVHGSVLTLVFHCIGLLISCQFSLVGMLFLPQPFGCVLPGV